MATDLDNGEDVDSIGTLLCMPDFDVNGLWGMDSVTAAMDAVGSESNLSRLVLGSLSNAKYVRSVPRSRCRGEKARSRRAINGKNMPMLQSLAVVRLKLVGDNCLFRLLQLVFPMVKLLSHGML